VPSGKTLDELADDMHTRPESLTHLMAKAEMELRRTSAQRRATTYMFVASIATAVAAAAITAGIAAYVALHGG
jgi:DNA-binding response OmpR family regulator